jgi:4'-phosphopantetheinyl transferase
LRTILSSYLHLPPKNLIFRYGKKGKPYLDDVELHFNLAHSGGKAIYAFGRDDLGVDIEFIKPWQDWQKISARFFSQREAEQLLKPDPATQIADFFACWARKEAYIKAIGEGMAVGLNQFYVGADRAIIGGPVEQNGHPPQWYFKDLDVGEQYAGALVTRFPACAVRVFSFDRVEEFLDYVETSSG